MTRMYSRVLEGILKIMWDLGPLFGFVHFALSGQASRLLWEWAQAGLVLGLCCTTDEKWIVGHFTNVVHSRRHGGGGQ